LVLSSSHKRGGRGRVQGFRRLHKGNGKLSRRKGWGKKRKGEVAGDGGKHKTALCRGATIRQAKKVNGGGGGGGERIERKKIDEEYFKEREKKQPQQKRGSRFDRTRTHELSPKKKGSRGRGGTTDEEKRRERKRLKAKKKK